MSEMWTSISSNVHGAFRTRFSENGPAYQRIFQRVKERPAANGPASQARPFTAQASHTGKPLDSPCPLLSFPSASVPSVSQSLWAQACGAWTSRIGHRGRSGRAEADLPDPDPSAAGGPRRKLLSLIPISIPISHVELVPTARHPTPENLAADDVTTHAKTTFPFE